MQGIAQPLRARATRLPSLRLRPGRKALVALVVALAVGLGYLGLRDASVLRVEEVTVTGLPAAQQARAQAALQRAAADMTTLHVREDRLRAALAPYASVEALHVDAQLPRTLAVEVVDRPAVAILRSAGRRVPVAADGRLLTEVRVTGALPIVSLDTIPTGSTLGDARAQASVRILAGAPLALRGRVRRARTGDRGLQVDLRDGPALIFGSDARVTAKWAAATRVLADAEAQGATYLDLRVPERTAAGGVGPVKSEEAEVPAPEEAFAPGAAPGATTGEGAAPAPETGTANPLP